jgi:hypothetical protein
MNDALLQGLSLVDVSGYAIITAIVLILALGVILTFAIRERYRRITADLRSNAHTGAFETPLLNVIARDARAALQNHLGEVNAQAIVDRNLQTGVPRLLIGERFVKASTGLLIVLGLVGTFYGLTLSIGKLAALVGTEVEDASAITESLTAGLTQALTGMSVAFSTSLFGILAAIVMTLLSVFCNVTDRRVEMMAELEAYLDNVLLQAARAEARSTGAQAPMAPAAHAGGGGQLHEDSIAAFGRTVDRLQTAVTHFEAALQGFSATTRDFREFNLHLKDNVQRMSLGFGDLSETLKEHARALQKR